MSLDMQRNPQSDSILGDYLPFWYRGGKEKVPLGWFNIVNWGGGQKGRRKHCGADSSSETQTEGKGNGFMNLL